MNQRPDHAEVGCMISTQALELIVLLAAGALSVLCLCYTMAARLGWDIELEKLRADARKLRAEYDQRVERLRQIGAMSGPADSEEPIEVSSIA